MKKPNIVICVVLLLSLCFMLAACNAVEQENLWTDALYTENQTFGSGSKTFEDALDEHKLIDGEQGPYGMYIKKVNGITADYDVDQSYWSLSQNGTPLATGASGVEIKGGEHFEFIHTM